MVYKICLFPSIHPSIPTSVHPYIHTSIDPYIHTLKASILAAALPNLAGTVAATAEFRGIWYAAVLAHAFPSWDMDTIHAQFLWKQRAGNDCWAQNQPVRTAEQWETLQHNCAIIRRDGEANQTSKNRKAGPAENTSFRWRILRWWYFRRRVSYWSHWSALSSTSFHVWAEI